jgi:hypothetical protein
MKRIILISFILPCVVLIMTQAILYQLLPKHATTSLVEPCIGHIEFIALDTPNPVEASIRYYSEEYGVDTETALRIGDCESKMGKYKTNWSGSSAKGVYQFIDKTWEHYCEGDVMNDEENIICFMKLYEEHSEWWECS